MRRGVTVVVLSFVAAGCASRSRTPDSPAAATGGAQSTTSPTTAHAPDDPALLALDQILPVPKLPEPKKSDAATPARPPVDALVWYAQARDALARGDRARATNLLEKASSLDPDSPEIYEELGKAYGAQDKALVAFEKALALDPDNLALHEKLGRQYLVKGRVDDALLHFRLGLQTTRYREDNEDAAVLDFFLATALRRKNYDRAAQEQYATLVGRLRKPGMSARTNPELLSLINQPEMIYGQMAELYEKHGQWAEAVRAYEMALDEAPESFDFQARLTRALASAGRPADARARAQSLVAKYRANVDSLKLFREVFGGQGGNDDQLIAALVALREDRPRDHSLLFALADAYKQSGRVADAEALLSDAARAAPDDGEVVRRLFNLYEERDDVEGAVRLLVDALAASPDSIRNLTPLWADLLKPSRRNRVRPSTLQKLRVDPPAEAARLFWLSRVADLWNRDAMSRAALERAVAIKPPFAPAYRGLIAEFWGRPDWDDAQKMAESVKLADAVREQGNPALAAELEGLALVRQKGRFTAAAEKLEQSIKLGNKAPDVHLARAVALRMSGEAARAEQLLWKIVSDTPGYEEAYVELFQGYFEQSQPSKAINVLGKWLAADPGNVRARTIRARIMHQAGRNDAAESELVALFNDQPESPEILAALYDFYTDVRRVDEFVKRLEDQRKAHPDNHEAVEQLALLYHKQKRPAEALRVLDAARQAVGNDPDLLYFIAHVYGRIDERATEEQLLEDVVRIDPGHAPASNDLGYGYADAGKNLARAEDLIRVAVDAEPDNQSFLDSLGWVLYKRGKFAEALTYFERAIGPATRPDPVVLDHMGDVQYRLSQPDQAVKQWKRAQDRLEQVSSEREDLKKLRLLLRQKLEQQQRGQPVDVAPIAETPAGPATQAKSTDN